MYSSYIACMYVITSSDSQTPGVQRLDHASNILLLLLQSPPLALKCAHDIALSKQHKSISASDALKSLEVISDKVWRPR